MDEDRLVTAMLTLGGSIKDNNSTGGFGAAKKLILFAHESYKIHTKDIHVDGKCLSYNLRRGEYRKGTHITATYINADDFQVSYMTSCVHDVLKKCHKPEINVTINGVKFTSWLNLGTKIKDIELGTIYKNSTANYYDHGYVHVLHNGLFMFDSFISGVSRNYYLNVVDKPSTEVFTQNRESFRGNYSNSFNQLILEIRTENKSFEKPKVKNFIWKGKDRFFNFILETTKKLAPEKIPNLQELFVYIQNCKTTQEISDACFQALGDKASIVSSQIVESNIPTDFHIDGEKTEEELKRYHPTTGLKKYRSVSSLYHNILVDLAKVYNVETFTFALGLCFDAEGRFKKIEGGNVFLINPEVWESAKSQKEKFYKVRAIAIHEFTHYLGYMRHDEHFASKITEVTYMADIHLKGMVYYMKKSL
jgi:hypothetical protein